MDTLLPFVVFCTSILVYSLSIRGIAENSLLYRNRLGLPTHEKFLNIIFPSNFRQGLSLGTVYWLSVMTYSLILLTVCQYTEQGIYSYMYGLLFLVLVSASVSDLYTQRLSDEVMYLGYTFIPATLILGVENFSQHLIFVSLAFVVMWGLNWLGLLGGGDVQLLITVGFFLTKAQFLTSFLLAAIIGVLFAVVIWSVKRTLGRIAFVPSILAGVVVTLLFDLNLFSYYFN